MSWVDVPEQKNGYIISYGSEVNPSWKHCKLTQTQLNDFITNTSTEENGIQKGMVKSLYVCLDISGIYDICFPVTWDRKDKESIH